MEDTEPMEPVAPPKSWKKRATEIFEELLPQYAYNCEIQVKDPMKSKAYANALQLLEEK